MATKRPHSKRSRYQCGADSPWPQVLCSTQLVADFHKQVSKILLIDGKSLSEKLLEEGRYSSRIKLNQR
jgi:hypothetical protein